MWFSLLNSSFFICVGYVIQNKNIVVWLNFNIILSIAEFSKILLLSINKFIQIYTKEQVRQLS
jgi:hypothetical protein